MKKLLIGVFVLATFVIYSFQQRHDTSGGVTPQTTTQTSPTTSTNNSTSATSSATPATAYKDGQYTGTAADAYYGYIQVQVTIKGGKLTDVEFLQYPNDRENSVQINEQAMPILKQEAIQAQSAQVDGVSGATDTSQAFVQSLTSALKDAQS